MAGLAGACVMEPEDSLGDQYQEIVNGQINNGDPAVGMVLMTNVGGCTGTLIANRVILTARHCILLDDGTVVPPNQVNMYWGTQPAQGDTPTPVVSHAYHPTADIAVLELAQAGPAAPIPMNTAALEPQLGMPVRVAGYGVTSENGQDSGTKRVGTTALFDFANSQLGTVMLIGNTGSKTCYGDSGGPAFMTLDGVEKLVGVTSFGTGPCEAAETLDGQIRVDIYHDWIMEFVTAKDPNGLPGQNGGTPGAGNTPTPTPGTGGDTTGDGTGTTADPNRPSPSDAVGGCSAAGGAGGAGLALALLGALVAVRRRVCA